MVPNRAKHHISISKNIEYNVNQYYPESVQLKQQLQEKSQTSFLFFEIFPAIRCYYSDGFRFVLYTIVWFICIFNNNDRGIIELGCLRRRGKLTK